MRPTQAFEEEITMLHISLHDSPVQRFRELLEVLFDTWIKDNTVRDNLID